jgi:hypothetical protein
MESDNQGYSVSNSDKLPQIDFSFGASKGYDPINELMRAMILRVIDDLRSGGEFQAEALAYIMDDSEEIEDEYIFSYPAICKHMGLDPVKTREMILHPLKRISTRRRAA